jgi:hypothetical protein
MSTETPKVRRIEGLLATARRYHQRRQSLGSTLQYRPAAHWHQQEAEMSKPPSSHIGFEESQFFGNPRSNQETKKHHLRYPRPWISDPRLKKYKYSNYIIWFFVVLGLLLSGYINYAVSRKIQNHQVSRQGSRFMLVLTRHSTVWSWTTTSQHSIRIPGITKFKWTALATAPSIGPRMTQRIALLTRKGCTSSQR